MLREMTIDGEKWIPIEEWVERNIEVLYGHPIESWRRCQEQLTEAVGIEDPASAAASLVVARERTDSALRLEIQAHTKTVEDLQCSRSEAQQLTQQLIALDGQVHEAMPQPEAANRNFSYRLSKLIESWKQRGQTIARLEEQRRGMLDKWSTLRGFSIETWTRCQDLLSEHTNLSNPEEAAKRIIEVLNTRPAPAVAIRDCQNFHVTVAPGDVVTIEESLSRPGSFRRSTLQL